MAQGAKTTNFRQRKQKLIKKHAHDAAEYVLTQIDTTALRDKERGILRDIIIRLLVKYFNGRELNLLTQDYLIAEAVDTILERNTEIINILAMEMAVAQMAAALGKFFKEHDTEAP